jgi:hypothetical protein
MSTLSLRKIKHDSSSTDNITLLSNGAVAMGTATTAITDEILALKSSGGHQLSLESTGANQAQLIIKSDSQRFQLGVGGSSMSGAPNQFYVYSNTSAKFFLKSTESGIVQFPYTPGFKVAWNNRDTYGGGVVTVGTNNGFSQNTGRDWYNNGNHYNVATGRFTVPVAGQYVFGTSLMRQATNGSNLETRWSKNGGQMWARSYASPYTSAYQQSMMVTITNAVAGDYFEWQLDTTNSSMYNDDTYCFGYFVG